MRFFFPIDFFFQTLIFLFENQKKKKKKPVHCKNLLHDERIAIMRARMRTTDAFLQEGKRLVVVLDPLKPCAQGCIVGIDLVNFWGTALTT